MVATHLSLKSILWLSVCLLHPQRPQSSTPEAQSCDLLHGPDELWSISRAVHVHILSWCPSLESSRPPCGPRSLLAEPLPDHATSWQQKRPAAGARASASRPKAKASTECSEDDTTSSATPRTRAWLLRSLQDLHRRSRSTHLPGGILLQADERHEVVLPLEALHQEQESMPCPGLLRQPS